MALVKMGAIVTDIRNSIGGVTFTRSRAGNVARARVKPTVSSSTKFNFNKARHTVVLDHWRNTLTNAQRIAWNAKAAEIRFINALGDAYTPTGLAAYARASVRLQELGLVLPTNPPAYLLSPVLAFYLEWNEGNTAVHLKSPVNQGPSMGGNYLYTWSQDYPASRYYAAPTSSGYSSNAYVRAVAMDHELLPASPTFRPARRTYSFRFFTVLYALSLPVIRTIYIPPAP